jgi:hypothetical protein
MRAYRLEITLGEDGALQLGKLPFHKGETVEVIVLERRPVSGSLPTPSLKGSVLRYADPTEPVARDDWEALQ